MDSTSTPVLSQSDPAVVNVLSGSDGPPALDPVIQLSATAAAAGVPACAPPPAAAMDASENSETIPAPTGDQTVGPAAPNMPPDFKSLQMKLLGNRIESLKRDRDEATEDNLSLDMKRRRAEENRLLTSVEDDPDEKTATADVKDPNWRWPAYDEVYDHSGNLRFAKRGKAAKLAKGFPFQVIYRNSRDVVLWPDMVQIKLKSPHLMAILSEYLPEEKDLQYLDNLSLDGRRVYVILDKLKNHRFSRDGDEKPANNFSAGLPSGKDKNGVSNGDSNGAPGDVNLATESSDSKDMISADGKNLVAGETVEEARLHLHHLVRFLEEEYTSVGLRLQHMKEDKSVSFDMLWAFLTPGTTVVYQCSYTQEQLCAKVTSNCYVQTNCGKLFSVSLAIWDYNGAVYRQCAANRLIGAFSGEKPFDTLGVRPTDMDRTTPAEVLEAGFRSRGRRFQQLAMQSSNCFMYYNGAIFRIRRDEIVKDKADGRAMIDLKSFAVMNPNYPMKNARPPVSSSNEDYEGRSIQTCVPNAGRFSNFNRAPPKRRVIRQAAPDAAEEAFLLKPSKEVEEENLIFAPAIVYGFSFGLKQWGAFAVTGFSEIEFDTNAFDALVMEPELKGLLYSLVSQFIATPAITSGSASVEEIPRADPIANKGEGCIFLCYGPPGTGKTLTAESLAENLRRPLWSLSVSELGTTPGDLEKTLLRILEIAAMWKAVLLLDEADVYLEKRIASADLTRNAMTGVFMRLLEYYRGVLFLTTNRITTFDDAFRSRISLVLCYPKLNKERRAQIWKAALARVQAGQEEEAKVGPEFLADMAKQKINGREIRNAIHTAQTLARSKNEDLQEHHLRFVMSVITKTSDILDAALREV